MSAKRAQQQGQRPEYLDLRAFLDLRQELDQIGQRFRWDETLLFIGEAEFTHEDCAADPDGAVALIRSYFDLPQATAGLNPIERHEHRTFGRLGGIPGDHIGLPGWEYDLSGRHISDKSG